MISHNIMSSTSSSLIAKGRFAVSNIFCILVLLLTIVGAFPISAYDELYIRGINGDWKAEADESYKLRIVEATKDRVVYNWTGTIPTSFIIADKECHLCLGDAIVTPEGILQKDYKAIAPSNLSFILSPFDDSFKAYYPEFSNIKISTSSSSNLTNRTLSLINESGSWSLKIMRTFHILRSDNEDEALNDENIMAASFDKTTNYYDWTGVLLISGDSSYSYKAFSFASDFNSNNYKYAYSGYPDIVSDGVYELVSSSHGIMYPSDDIGYTHYTLKIGPESNIEDNNQIKNILITKTGKSTLGYCLLTDSGEIVEMEEEFGVAKVSLTPGIERFVIGVYPRESSNPSVGLADLTGYWTNGGGVPFYSEERLSFVEGSVTDLDAISWMSLPEDPSNLQSGDPEWTFEYSFDTQTDELTVSGPSSWVHHPIFFVNESYEVNGESVIPFEEPRIKIVSTEGKLYTSACGSLMKQPGKSLFGMNEKYWRYDLWVPEHELTAHEISSKTRKKHASPTYEHEDPSRTVISPDSYLATNGTPSNLHITFSDGETGDTEAQFSNVPLYPGGVYSVGINNDNPKDDLKHIYLLFNDGSYTELTQMSIDSYTFSGTITRDINDDNQIISFYVATQLNDSMTAPADGSAIYGARGTDGYVMIASTMLTNKYNFNGKMTLGSDNPWVIDMGFLYENGLNQHPEYMKKNIDVMVQINPDGNRLISFGFNSDDFVTTVSETVVQKGVRWFDLQGQPVINPSGGLFIRVSDEGARKIFVQ